MIKLTRLDGSDIYLNHINIQWIETTPDTTITVINGARIIVKENLSTVLKLIDERIQREHQQTENDATRDENAQKCMSSDLIGTEQKFIMT